MNDTAAVNLVRCPVRGRGPSLIFLVSMRNALRAPRAAAVSHGSGWSLRTRGLSSRFLFSPFVSVGRGPTARSLPVPGVLVGLLASVGQVWTRICMCVHIRSTPHFSSRSVPSRWVVEARVDGCTGRREVRRGTLPQPEYTQRGWKSHETGALANFDRFA